MLLYYKLPQQKTWLTFNLTFRLIQTMHYVLYKDNNMTAFL